MLTSAGCPISNLKTDLIEFDVIKNGTKLDFVYQIEMMSIKFNSSSRLFWRI